MLLALWKQRNCTINMSVYITEKILEKNFSFPCHTNSVVVQTVVVPFLRGPILTQRSHFIVRLWWSTGPTLPQCWPNFTPNYEAMLSHWDSKTGVFFLRLPALKNIYTWLLLISCFFKMMYHKQSGLCTTYSFKILVSEQK